MNSGYQLKAYTRDKMNIGHFAKTYGIGRGNTFFFTLTFKNNVINKKEASRMWHNLLSQINKRFSIFRYIMISERQKRGAWHFHILCSSNIPSLNRFIRFVEYFIRTSGFCYGFVNAKWTNGKDYNGISIYLTKYLTKERREKGVRYVAYSNNWQRLARLPFAWVGGKSADWRKRCRECHEVLGVHFKNFYSNSTYLEKTNCILSETLNESISLVRRWLNSSDKVTRRIFRTIHDNVYYCVDKHFEVRRNYSGEIFDAICHKTTYEVKI